MAHASTREGNKGCKIMSHVLLLLSDLHTVSYGDRILCVKKWVTTFFPQSLYPDISSGIWVHYGDWSRERLSHQWLQLWLNLDIAVDFFHAWCQKSAGSSCHTWMKPADLGMVQGVSISTWTDGRQIIQRPAVAKMNVVMKVSFYNKEEAVSVHEPPFSCACTNARFKSSGKILCRSSAFIFKTASWRCLKVAFILLSKSMFCMRSFALLIIGWQRFGSALKSACLSPKSTTGSSKAIPPKCAGSLMLHFAIIQNVFHYCRQVCSQSHLLVAACAVGMVCWTKFHWCCKPNTKPAWRCVFALPGICKVGHPFNPWGNFLV